MARSFALSAIIAAACIFAAAPAWAKWAATGVAVSAAEYDQSQAVVISDGADGAIVAWVDYRAGTNTDIYAQRLDPFGNALWAADGVPVCTLSADVYDCRVVPDGAGGAIVVWRDWRAWGGDIYAQRLDAGGNALWTANGVAVSVETFERLTVEAVSDGAGGAIISWNGFSVDNGDIYLQRIDSNGDALWTAGGVVVVSHPAEQQGPRIVSDGSNGAVVAWVDSRDAVTAIYAQRISAAGARLWTPDGVPVCPGGASQYEYALALSGSGVIFALREQRYAYGDLYLQRLDLGGSPLWTAGGIVASTYASEKYDASIVEDLEGGAIVAWRDRRGSLNYLYAQRVSAEGSVAWGAEGMMVFDPYQMNRVNMRPDGFGGALLPLEYYDSGTGHYGISIQRVDGNGTLLWPSPRGAITCSAAGQRRSAVPVADGRGGAIVAWEDGRSGAYWDVYAQRIGPLGLWGNPEPVILSCGDVPADEGGYARIRARASALDVEDELENPIVGYTVWREIENGGGEPEAALLGLPEGEWESVAYWFATRDTAYYVAVPTKSDSTEAGIPWETYLVTAHTAVAGVFIASEPAAGYSVDNLSPAMTEGFAGEETASPPGLRLAWTPNPAPDLWKYDIHRGGDAGFTPDASNLVGSTGGTEYHDGEWLESNRYFYKLVAVDRHGNISPAATLAPGDVKVATLLQSYAAALAGSCVEISWTLSEIDDGAIFEMMRAEGADAPFARLEAAAIERQGFSYLCRDGSVEPGTAYRYRLDVVDGAARRTLFETDAIAVPSMPLALRQNHPNPFNPSTSIDYCLPAACAVTLEIFDAAGRLVSRLLDGVAQERGAHSLVWRGTDDAGRPASSGVYFYRLRAGRETLTRKMVLMK